MDIASYAADIRIALDIRVNDRGRPYAAAINARKQADILAIHTGGLPVDIEIIDAVGIRTAIARETAGKRILFTANRVEAMAGIPGGSL